MSIADELEKLRQIYLAGGLTDEEYGRAKAAVIAGHARWAAADIEAQTRQWAMALHLSILAGFVVPIAGLIVPILIWQLKRAELPGLDIHGRIVVNWLISFLLYAAISLVLIFLLIGIPLLALVIIAGIVFPVIGGIKAGNGEAWRYPSSIGFLK